MSDETPKEPTTEPAPATPQGPATPVPATPEVPAPAAVTPPPAIDAGTSPAMPASPAAMATTAPASAKKGKRTLALVVAGLVVIAAGGAAFAFMQLRGSSDALMHQVPASADIVATVYLDPAASQKVNLFRMTDQFPVLGSESDLTQRLNTILDGEPLASLGLNHNDVQWLGSQAAVVVDFPGAATPNIEVLINVDDVGAAKATLDKVRSNPLLGGGWKDTTYKGVTVSTGSTGVGAYAFVGDTLVISSTSAGVDSIIDTDQGGASLADSADFTATSDGLPEGRLAFVYVNVKALLPLATSLGFPTIPGVSPNGVNLAALQAIRGFGMTISAEPNGLAMDFNESFDPTKLSDSQKTILTGASHDNPLTSYVPSNAIGLVQLEHMDAIASAAITQLETTDPSMSDKLVGAGVTGPDGLLSALTGDMTLEIAPGTPGLPVSGALILGINDPSKFAAAINKLKDQLLVITECSSSASASVNYPGSIGVTTSTSSKCRTIPAPKWQTQDYKGTTIYFVTDSSGGGPSVAYATVDGAGFIGIGPDSIKALIDAKAGQNITSNTNFTTAQAVVPSQAQFFYLDVQGALEAAAASAPDATLSQAITNLKPITAVAIGSETGADHTHSRFMILIP